LCPPSAARRPPLMPLASKPITPLHQSLLRLLHSYSQPSACPPLLKSIPLRANSVLFRRDVHRHLLGARYFSARTVRGIARGGGLRTDRFKVQTRGHMGHHHHGHDHGHGGHEHDTTLLTSKDTSNPGVRITRIGLYISPDALEVDFQTCESSVGVHKGCRGGVIAFFVIVGRCRPFCSRYSQRYSHFEYDYFFITRTHSDIPAWFR
jgi:hypothetical protein